MLLVANIAVGIIASLHVYILMLEMFLWDNPAGLKAFDNDSEEGEKFAASPKVKVLAANQGLYNGFLAASLFWSLSLGASGANVKVFFLCCVLIAGLYGAASTRKIKILFIQTIPAALALALIFLSRG